MIMLSKLKHYISDFCGHIMVLFKVIPLSFSYSNGFPLIFLMSVTIIKITYIKISSNKDKLSIDVLIKLR